MGTFKLKKMDKQNLAKFAKDLAEEIATRNIYEVDEVSTLIKVWTMMYAAELVKEYATEAELEYIHLLKQQSLKKMHSKDYVELGYKLSLAKHKKAAANRAASEISNDVKYRKLRDFVVQNYGRNALDDFFHNALNEVTEAKK